MRQFISPSVVFIAHVTKELECLGFCHYIVLGYRYSFYKCDDSTYKGYIGQEGSPGHVFHKQGSSSVKELVDCFKYERGMVIDEDVFVMSEEHRSELIAYGASIPVSQTSEHERCSKKNRVQTFNVRVTKIDKHWVSERTLSGEKALAYAQEFLNSDAAENWEKVHKYAVMSVASDGEPIGTTNQLKRENTLGVVQSISGVQFGTYSMNISKVIMNGCQEEEAVYYAKFILNHGECGRGWGS